MASYRLIRELNKSLKHVEHKEPKTWFGNWFKRFQIKAIKGRINEIQKNLKEKKNG